jgi:hypothetical protein
VTFGWTGGPLLAVDRDLVLFAPSEWGGLPGGGQFGLLEAFAESADLLVLQLAVPGDR